MEFPVYASNSGIGRRNTHHPFNTLPAMLDKQCSVYLLIDFRTFWYNPRAFDGKKEKSIQETFLKYGQIRFL